MTKGACRKDTRVNLKGIPWDKSGTTGPLTRIMATKERTFNEKRIHETIEIGGAGREAPLHRRMPVNKCGRNSTIRKSPFCSCKYSFFRQRSLFQLTIGSKQWNVI